jgi:hypothetical protein
MENSFAFIGNWVRVQRKQGFGDFWFSAHPNIFSLSNLSAVNYLWGQNNLQKPTSEEIEQQLFQIPSEDLQVSMFLILV